MKRCGKCGEVKPFNDFYKAHTKMCGYGSYCKRCQHEHYKHRYHHRTKVLKQEWQPFKVEYTDRNRIYVSNFLKENPCVDCGETDIFVLEFDHVRGTKRASISYMVRSASALESLKAEIAKCVVRCANCHRRKTWKERGWFDKSAPIFRRAKKGKRAGNMVALDFGPEYSCLVLAPLAQW